MTSRQRIDDVDHKVLGMLKHSLARVDLLATLSTLQLPLMKDVVLNFAVEPVLDLTVLHVQRWHEEVLTHTPGLASYVQVVPDNMYVACNKCNNKPQLLFFTVKILLQCSLTVSCELYHNIFMESFHENLLKVP